MAAMEGEREVVEGVMEVRGLRRRGLMAKIEE